MGLLDKGQNDDDYLRSLINAKNPNAQTNSGIGENLKNALAQWVIDTQHRISHPAETVQNAVDQLKTASPQDMALNWSGGGVGGMAGIFAGVGAKTADVAALGLANEMKAAGVADRAIHAKTGWTFGFPDGKPRFEIPDNGAMYRGTQDGSYIDQAIHHPKLFEDYPQLGGGRIQETKGAGGSYTQHPMGGTGVIQIGMDGSPTSTALHELQHTVQDREGFARGGSPESMMPELSTHHANFDMPPPAPIDAYSAYRRLAGETEARLTQSRMNMTPAERAASYPPDMFDVPVENQIVRYGDGQSMSIRNMLQDVLHNPPQGLIDADIGLNRMLGGGNQTLSATIGQNRGNNYLAGKAANVLDNLDPGHIQNALANVTKVHPVASRTLDDLLGGGRMINPPLDGSAAHLPQNLQDMFKARDALAATPHQGYQDGGDQIKNAIVGALHSPSVQFGGAGAVGAGLLASPASAQGGTWQDTFQKITGQSPKDLGVNDAIHADRVLKELDQLKSTQQPQGGLLNAIYGNVGTRNEAIYQTNR